MPRASYGGAVPAASDGGVVACVAPASPAARAGIVPGDRIVEAEGRLLADVLDWAWVSDDQRVEATVLGSDGAEREVVLERDFGEAWGIEFVSAVFDGVRVCRNDCGFCFMRQLPRGMRPSLYVRDDDFRLSFLHGNFITLTNLTDADVARIAEQRLSPLYVSLHAVDPEVRRNLVCTRGEDRALTRFDELLAEKIALHVQVVLVPGVNDGPELERTLSWLAEREGVASVGIVPLGFTQYQERFTASYADPHNAAAVIAQVEPWQVAFREQDGVALVHLADEFYLNAGQVVPPWDSYDGAPQYENGIGMVRAFLDGVTSELGAPCEGVGSPLAGARVVYVTGELFAPVLEAQLPAVSGITGAEPRVLAVRNAFFGGNVSVTGLLTGADIADAIAADAARHKAGAAAHATAPAAAIYAVPDIVLNADGVTLDDMTLPQLRERSGADVRLVSSDPAGLLLGS